MKRLYALVIALAVLLVACASPGAMLPEGTTNEIEGTTEIEATTEALPQTHPPGATSEVAPFTPDDITAMFAGMTTVRDFVRAFNPPYFHVQTWAADGSSHVEFLHNLDTVTNEWGSELRSSFLILELTGRGGYCEIYHYMQAMPTAVRELTPTLLNAPAWPWHFSMSEEFPQPLQFAPRGVKVGDPAQAIFTAFPDLRANPNDIVLYDVTLIHAHVEPTRGEEYGDFLGGRIVDGNVHFRYAPIIDAYWFDEEMFFIGNAVNRNLALVFDIENDVITSIRFYEWFLRN